MMNERSTISLTLPISLGGETVVTKGGAYMLSKFHFMLIEKNKGEKFQSVQDLLTSLIHISYMLAILRQGSVSHLGGVWHQLYGTRIEAFVGCNVNRAGYLSAVCVSCTSCRV